jgi:ATP-dependent Lon protease
MNNLDLYNDKDIKKIRKCQRIFRSRIKEINDINKKMNICYNSIYSIMKRIHNNFVLGIISQYEYNFNNVKLDEELENFKNIPKPLKLYHLKSLNMNDIKTQIFSISENIFDIMKRVGINCIFDSLILVTKKPIKKILGKYENKDKNLIYFYNNVFIPISIDIYDDNINNEINSIVPYNNKNISKRSYDIKNINMYNYPCSFNMYKKNKTFLENIQGARFYLKIEIDNKQKYLVYDGYFLEDPLNISRIGGQLEKKNNELIKKIEDIDINNYFKTAFIQQISIRDFLVFDIDYLIDMCIKSFQDLCELKKKTISSLVNDFLNSDLSTQRNILTLFLLMKDNVDMQYIAYLMYDMISNESYLLKPQPLAEQVFNSLHWSVQKIFKVAIKKINKYTNDILNFSEKEISYEKRILLMKTNNYVKSRVMEKYKEYCKSGENSTKCLQYIDGILKIPFNIYRKEKILSFLGKFKMEFNIFIINYINEYFKIFKEYQKNDILDLCLEFFNINKARVEIKSKLKHIKNFNKKINSVDIDEFINRFNCYMYKNSDDIVELEYLYKLCKKLRKPELKKLIKMINDELESTNQKEKLINENGKMVDLLLKINNFIIDPSNFDIAIKYINYLDKDRQQKIHNNDNIFCSNMNNKFFDLNTQWFNYKSNYKEYLKNVDNILDKSIYHQDEAKLQIKRIIAQWINGEMKGYCFGFEGPPGTGKTSLAKKGISQCLNDDNGSTRPFAFIAIGGTSNGSTLEGHSYTYVGSTWGRIVDILMETQCMNPIIYIDELDKISNTENGKEIIGILTHLTDSTQNDEFMDKYFSGVKIDLSKVLFIFSYNDYNLLDSILADRIHRVKFKKLNRFEKIHISQNFIIPELLETVGLKEGNIIFTKKILEYIIINYTHEAGVRKLKEKLFEIIREINLRYLVNETDKHINLPFSVTIEFIEDVFKNKTKITSKKITCYPMIGIVNGLYATNSGMGGITIIESFRTPTDSKLSLELTGQQGDVMKESMKVAKTVAWNLIPDEIKQKIYVEMKNNGNFGIHLHCPEAATPKDGPSAGCAITLAIVSLLTNTKIKNDVALTGEIDLNGSVHEIGGLEHKIEGGKMAGVKLILYPKQNEKDINLIKSKGYILDDTIETRSVKNIWEVLEYCLVDNNINFNKYSI